MRSAVFITPESLFSRPKSVGANDAKPGTPIFRLASQAVRALHRLKQAGYVIIGIAGEEFFHGFASRSSCREFLAATELDDVIIARGPGPLERCRNSLIRAAGKWLVDLDRSFIIGRTDEISGAGLTGCTPLKIGVLKEQPVQDDFAAPTLTAAVDRILEIDPRAANAG